MKISNNDGSLKFGSYELPVYNYPLRDITQPELNEKLNFSFAFILNEAKPLADSKPQDNDKTQERFPNEEEKRLELDEMLDNQDENGIEVSPEDMNIKDKENKAYIPNSMRQHEEVQYDEDDIIVLFIDSCRYLPENVSMTQIS